MQSAEGWQLLAGWQLEQQHADSWVLDAETWMLLHRAYQHSINAGALLSTQCVLANAWLHHAQQCDHVISESVPAKDPSLFSE